MELFDSDSEGGSDDDDDVGAAGKLKINLFKFLDPSILEKIFCMIQNSSWAT